MPTLDGTKVRSDILQMAQRRKEHLEAAAKIAREIEKIGLDANTLAPFRKTGYTNMESSQLAQLVLAQKNDVIYVADVAELLKKKKVKCSPYVLLTRMVKAHLLIRTARGVYAKT